MSRRNLRRALAVSALALTLTLWAPVRTEAASFEAWEMASLWERGWSWLAGLWEKQGPMIDPNGSPGNQEPPSSPNGGTGSNPVPEDGSGDQGPMIDPNG